MGGVENMCRNIPRWTHQPHAVETGTTWVLLTTQDVFRTSTPRRISAQSIPILKPLVPLSKDHIASNSSQFHVVSGIIETSHLRPWIEGGQDGATSSLLEIASEKND